MFNRVDIIRAFKDHQIMKQGFLLLVLGFLAGIALMKTGSSPHDFPRNLEPYQPFSTSQEIPSTKTELTNSNASVPRTAPSTAPSITMNPTPSALANGKGKFPLEASQVKFTQLMSNTISEETIAKLEGTDAQLRDSIYSELVETGWRIHVLQNENLLTQKGVIDGDVITFRSLEKQRQLDSKKAELANRMETILNRIQR